MNRLNVYSVARESRSRPRSSFEQRKEEIYAKAAVLLAQHGYRNTTMVQIAKAANLKKGGLYHYIKSKETLLYEILSGTLDIFLERAEHLCLDGFSPQDKLRLLIHEYTTTLVCHFNEVVLIVLASKYLRPKLRDVIYRKRIRYEQYIYSVLAEGLSQKLFIEHDDNRTMGFLIIGAIFNYYLWHPQEVNGDVEGRTERFSDFFLKGLLAH